MQPRGPLWGLCSLEQGQFSSRLNYKAGSSVSSPSLQMRQLRCKEGGVTWLHISPELFVVGSKHCVCDCMGTCLGPYHQRGLPPPPPYLSRWDPRRGIFIEQNLFSDENTPTLIPRLCPFLLRWST